MTNHPHRAKVIQVVANVEHTLEANALLSTVFLQDGFFVADSLQTGNLQFFGARGDNRVFFRGKNQRGNSLLAKEIEGQPVRPVAKHCFAPVIKNQHAVVGQHAVEVENDEFGSDSFWFHGLVKKWKVWIEGAFAKPFASILRW